MSNRTSTEGSIPKRWVMVVCAGLRHTPTVLARLGISRTERPMLLASFDSADAEEAVTCNLEVMAAASPTLP